MYSKPPSFISFSHDYHRHDTNHKFGHPKPINYGTWATRNEPHGTNRYKSLEAVGAYFKAVINTPTGEQVFKNHPTVADFEPEMEIDAATGVVTLPKFWNPDVTHRAVKFKQAMLRAAVRVQYCKSTVNAKWAQVDRPTGIVKKSLKARPQWAAKTGFFSSESSAVATPRTDPSNWNAEDIDTLLRHWHDRASRGERPIRFEEEESDDIDINNNEALEHFLAAKTQLIGAKKRPDFLPTLTTASVVNPHSDADEDSGSDDGIVIATIATTAQPTVGIGLTNFTTTVASTSPMPVLPPTPSEGRALVTATKRKRNRRSSRAAVESGQKAKDGPTISTDRGKSTSKVKGKAKHVPRRTPTLSDPDTEGLSSSGEGDARSESEEGSDTPRPRQRVRFEEPSPSNELGLLHMPDTPATPETPSTAPRRNPPRPRQRFAGDPRPLTGTWRDAYNDALQTDMQPTSAPMALPEVAPIRQARPRPRAKLAVASQAPSVQQDVQQCNSATTPAPPPSSEVAGALFARNDPRVHNTMTPTGSSTPRNGVVFTPDDPRWVLMDLRASGGHIEAVDGEERDPWDGTPWRWRTHDDGPPTVEDPSEVDRTPITRLRARAKKTV